MKNRWGWFLTTVAVCLLVLLLGWGLSTFLVSYQERLELQADVALALTFFNMAQTPTPDVLELRGVPRALRTKEQLALYYLLKAAEHDKELESGALFHLGLYFLREDDCELARHYFSGHLAAGGRQRGVEEALALLTEKDCQPEVTENVRGLVGLEE